MSCSLLFSISKIFDFSSPNLISSSIVSVKFYPKMLKLITETNLCQHMIFAAVIHMRLVNLHYRVFHCLHFLIFTFPYYVEAKFFNLKILS